MKKFFWIVALLLSLSGSAFAKTINIEDKVFLNVPENFEYFKIDFDEIADYYVDFFSDIGLGDGSLYYIATKPSIDFAKSLINEPDSFLEPIYKNIEQKGFGSEEAMLRFATKEIKKLMKKYNYQGVIWVFLSVDNLEDTDEELFETSESIKKMNKADMKKLALDFKKNIKGELNTNEIEGINLKISKFNIEKNKVGSPAFDLKVTAKMFNIKFSSEIYGYLKNNKPVLIGAECMGKCKGISDVKNKIVY